MIQLIACFTEIYPVHQHRFLSMLPIMLFMCVKKEGKMAFATPYIEHGILTYAIGTQWHILSEEVLYSAANCFRFCVVKTNEVI
jgi:hypothetical protein